MKCFNISQVITISRCIAFVLTLYNIKNNLTDFSFSPASLLSPRPLTINFSPIVFSTFSSQPSTLPALSIFSALHSSLLTIRTSFLSLPHLFSDIHSLIHHYHSSSLPFTPSPTSKLHFHPSSAPVRLRNYCEKWVRVSGLMLSSQSSSLGLVQLVSPREMPFPEPRLLGIQ